jgi:cytochrome c-type biogenesis protein CcmH/NrfG
VLSRRGLWTEAAAQLRRAIAADAARSEAWYYLGEALNHVDDLSGALDAFARAAELSPANARAFHGQGKVLDRMNRPEDATRMYRRAREVTRR